jgi:CheY-like chemotaxis protein
MAKSEKEKHPSGEDREAGRRQTAPSRRRSEKPKNGIVQAKPMEADLSDLLHKLGNLLGTVLMNAEIGVQETAEESEERRCFESILEAGRYARDAVDQYPRDRRRWEKVSARRTTCTPAETLPDAFKGGRVLLVDDEESLRILWGRMIESLGCSVTRAADAESALKWFQADPMKVDLVITDLNMPGISGLELSETIHRVRPELPILLSTGFQNECDSDELHAAGVCGLLKKPLERSELAFEIEKAFSGRLARS